MVGVANVEAAMHKTSGEWASLLGAQLCSPVRWRQTLLTLQGEGATTLIEIGPGAALTGMAKRTLPDAHRVTINTPDHLDGLLEQLSHSSTAAPAHEGEQLFATERLVVSPAAGVFTPNDSIETGSAISRGTVIGTVGETEVRSAFAGDVQGFLALPGERVSVRQPIAWLRQK